MKWREGPISLHLSTHGYYGIPELSYPAVRSYDADGRERWSYIHRLNAVAWFYDPDQHESPLDVLEPIEVEQDDGSVELEDAVVHHVDGAPPNNSEDNFEILPESEHNQETWGPSRSWFELEELADLVEDQPAPTAVADGGRP